MRPNNDKIMVVSKHFDEKFTEHIALACSPGFIELFEACLGIVAVKLFDLRLYCTIALHKYTVAQLAKQLCGLRMLKKNKDFLD